MIKSTELKTFEDDVLDFYEEVISLNTRYPGGIADQIFNHKITARLRELLEVARNIERASFNREAAEVFRWK